MYLKIISGTILACNSKLFNNGVGRTMNTSDIPLENVVWIYCDIVLTRTAINFPRLLDLLTQHSHYHHLIRSNCRSMEIIVYRYYPYAGFRILFVT